MNSFKKFTMYDDNKKHEWSNTSKDIEVERKENAEILKEATKTIGERRCFCDLNKEDEYKESVRKEIIRRFAEDKEECNENGGILIMRPYAKELDFVYFVDAEEYTNDISFHAQRFPIDYCPYCGRKL